MTSPQAKNHFDTIIVGAGLSGLAAAQTLGDYGRNNFVVLEKSDLPGGRVKTIEVDGFRLDLGFQVGLSSYPAFWSILSLKELNPCYFASGALIEEHRGKLICLANPLRHPAGIINGLRSGLPALDRFRLVRLAVSCLLTSDENCLKPADRASLEWLKDRGFSDAILNQFFRPFFGGVFLDNDLDTDASLLRYYLKKFITGRAFIPQGGVGNMSRKLADKIPREKIRYSTEVESIETKDEEVSVKLKNIEDPLTSKHLIMATDPNTTTRLMEWDRPDFRSTKVVYFKSDLPVYEGRWIILPSKPKRLGQHFVQLTNIDPSLAPEGQSLLSVTVLNDRGLSDSELAIEVKKEISELFPDSGKELELVKVISVPHALPVQSPEARSSIQTRECPEGIILAGDLVNNASLQNALGSGKSAALRAMNRL